MNADEILRKKEESERLIEKVNRIDSALKEDKDKRNLSAEQKNTLEREYCSLTGAKTWDGDKYLKVQHGGQFLGRGFAESYYTHSNEKEQKPDDWQDRLRKRVLGR